MTPSAPYVTCRFVHPRARWLSVATLAAGGAHAAAAAAQPPPPADPPPPAPAQAAPPTELEPIDVTVHGEKDEPGATTIDRQEIREMPGGLGDPFRAIEAKPGVTPTASGIPYYFIRGAPPGNIGYFYDGIQVPLLFHVGAGPGVIPPAIVQRLDLHLGPYPARLGRLAGAVVEVESTAPSSRWRGEGALRGIEASGVVEGPVARDVTLLGGARWAYGAPLLTYLVPSVALGYGDYQARASVASAPGESWSALAFGAWDYLARIDDQERREVLLDSDFHRLDLRYRRSRGGTTEAAVTLGLDQSRGAGADLARDFKIGMRTSVERTAVPGRLLLRAGADIALDVYDIDPSDTPCVDCEPGSLEFVGDELEATFPELFPSRTDLALGGWVDALVVLGSASTLNPGLRIDHYTSLGDSAVAVDPRLIGRFGVVPRVTLVPAVGIASQRPGFAPIPALQIGGIPGGLQRSLQTSFGVELGAMPFELLATVFRHATFGLTDPIGSSRGTDVTAERFLQRTTGDAYGLELSTRAALHRRLLMLGSYTLSRATRTRQGRTVPSAYDRTHVLHVAFLYDLGNSWKAGVRHVFYSGFPADEAAEGRLPSEHPDRTRPFYRLDVRLAKRWRVGESGWVSLVFDIQNATLSKEVFDVECNESGACQPRTLGPISIPALALEAGF